MLRVTSTRDVTWYSLKRLVRKEAHRQGSILAKQWAPRRKQVVLLSSSLTVLRNQEERQRQRLLDEGKLNHAELSPVDCQDSTFFTVPKSPRMKLFEEWRESLPSSSETLNKIEQAKEKFTSSFHELTERLNNEPLSHIITEKASKITEQATLETELGARQVAESLSETIVRTEEIIENITHRLVKSPEPGVVKPIACPEPNHQHVDIGLTDEIISLNKKKSPDQDTELMPRIKKAVRQLKAEIDADDSGDPPLSLVSRKAKERIETFIKNKRAEMQVKISEKLDLVKDITVVGRKEKSEEGVLEYITSKVPNCDKEDPELQDIVSDHTGTFYNDAYLIDDIDVEDDETLTSSGWSKEIAQEKYRIWKKNIPEESVTLYKIFGQFDTVSAVEFYNAQVNDQYRSTWDKSVSSLYVVDNITNNREIVYWATKFPFPLQDRDYVFERSHLLDENTSTIEIASRSITHKSKPELPKFVRVCKYGSKLVIRADKDIYQKGMSYCLTYYDDFGMPIPNQVKDRLANTKIPEFLDKVHDAAVFLGSTGKLYVPYPASPLSQRK
ncbi:hypothetical protein ACHWQZ_G007572 [Mnemiopsis leidyi]